MTELIVPKYGGSVFTDADSYRRVAKYQLSRGRVAVVSAMSRVTDRLEAIYDNRDMQALAQLKKAYFEIVKSLPSEIREAAVREIEKDMGREGETGNLHVYLDMGAKDAFVGSGEGHSAIFLASHINALGGNAEFLSGTEAGFLLDNHGWVDMDRSREPLRVAARRIMDQLKIAVVGGYFGRHNKTGQWKAGARNINDAFAVAEGDALGADAIEIVKDVPAIYRVPKKLDEFVFGDYGSLGKLSYDETRKMSSRGSIVIHPQAIVLAQSKKLPIIVKNMESEGTVITAESQTTREKPFAAIVPDKAPMITIRDDIMDTPEGRGYWARVAGFEEKHGVDIGVIPSDIGVISYTISLGDKKGPKKDARTVLRQHNEELREYLNSMGYNPKIDGEEVGMITVVGDEMQNRPGTLAYLTEILAREEPSGERTSVRAFVQSDEKYARPSMVIVVNLDSFEAAVKVLADELFV